MTAVDMLIVNVALPTIGVKLHFAESDLQWVVTAYALAFGGFLLLGGRAADLLGRRRMFMAGLALFTAASLGCALATSGTFLIIMRGVQGLGAAAVLPAALSIVMNMFPEGAERNKALGIWGAIGASGATVGVLAGGALTRYAGWPYIFYLNVAVGGAALLLTRRVVPESRLHGRPPPLRPARRRHRDRRPGAGGLRDLAGAGRRLDRRPDRGPARGGGGPAGRVRDHRGQGGGAAAAAAAVPAADPRRVQRGRLPARGQLLRLHLHRHPVHAAGARILADETGLAWLIVGLTGVAMAGPAQLLVTRTSVRLVMAAGMTLTGAGILWLTQAPAHASFWGGLAGPFLLTGAVTWVFIPVSIGALVGVRERDAGIASGLIDSSQQLGGAIGIAVASTVAAARSRALLGQGHAIADALAGGFHGALWVCGLVALTAVPVALVLVRRTETARAAASPAQREAPAPAPAPTDRGRR